MRWNGRAFLLESTSPYKNFGVWLQMSKIDRGGGGLLAKGGGGLLQILLQRYLQERRERLSAVHANTLPQRSQHGIEGFDTIRVSSLGLKGANTAAGKVKKKTVHMKNDSQHRRRRLTNAARDNAQIVRTFDCSSMRPC